MYCVIRHSHNLNQRLNFKIETHSTASLVPLIDTCRSGGANCPGGGSDEQKNIQKKHLKSNDHSHLFCSMPSPQGRERGAQQTVLDLQKNKPSELNSHHYSCKIQLDQTVFNFALQAVTVQVFFLDNSKILLVQYKHELAPHCSQQTSFPGFTFL